MKYRGVFLLLPDLTCNFYPGVSKFQLSTEWISWVSFKTSPIRDFWKTLELKTMNLWSPYLLIHIFHIYILRFTYKWLSLQNVQTPAIPSHPVWKFLCNVSGKSPGSPEAVACILNKTVIANQLSKCSQGVQHRSAPPVESVWWVFPYVSFH